MREFNSKSGQTITSFDGTISSTPLLLQQHFHQRLQRLVTEVCKRWHFVSGQLVSIDNMCLRIDQAFQEVRIRSCGRTFIARVQDALFCSHTHIILVGTKRAFCTSHSQCMTDAAIILVIDFDTLGQVHLADVDAA